MTANDYSILTRGLVTQENLIDREAEVNSWLLAAPEEKSNSIYNKMYQLLKDFNTTEEDLISFKHENINEERALVKEIISYLKKIPVVTITLAFIPDSRFLETLRQELSMVIGEFVVVDTSKNLGIVGGMLLEFKGKYRDYSLSSKLSESLHKQLEDSKIKEAK